MNFKSWLQTDEATARTRAASNPGIPAQAGLVFTQTPYSADSFCKKIKQPGVKLMNMKVGDVCNKNVKS